MLRTIFKNHGSYVFQEKGRRFLIIFRQKPFWTKNHGSYIIKKMSIMSREKSDWQLKF